jgi:hypothetical protein
VYVYTSPSARSPFATSIVEYVPAPGQFVSDPHFNDPDDAPGPPNGGGTEDGTDESLVTLGGFGGTLNLRFDHFVEDDPLNPFGVDAIVFGNAFWQQNDPQRHWAECATIEIAWDANANGRIDEEEGWYLIPGSHIDDPATQFTSQSWDDDPGTSIPPELLSWVPIGRSGLWTTEGYLLPDETFGQSVIVNPSGDPTCEAIYGYAEYTPTLLLGDLDGDNVVEEPSISPEEFYTTPDDPFTVGITPGSGGGDAFDIAWAVDPITGLPAQLPGFDFIRLTNGVNAIMGIFGEKSPEIDAVADVAPDPFGDIDRDGDIDLADTALFQECFGRLAALGSQCDRADRNSDGRIEGLDVAAFVRRLTGPR